jgi:hypothetical protein
MDGARILAAGATMRDVYEETDRLGLAGGDFVMEYIREDS